MKPALKRAGLLAVGAAVGAVAGNLWGAMVGAFLGVLTWGVLELVGLLAKAVDRLGEVAAKLEDLAERAEPRGWSVAEGGVLVPTAIVDRLKKSWSAPLTAPDDSPGRSAENEL